MVVRTATNASYWHHPCPGCPSAHASAAVKEMLRYFCKLLDQGVEKCDTCGGHAVDMQ